jgi:hypothetical protein
LPSRLIPPQLHLDLAELCAILRNLRIEGDEVLRDLLGFLEAMLSYKSGGESHERWPVAICAKRQRSPRVLLRLIVILLLPRLARPLEIEGCELSQGNRAPWILGQRRSPDANLCIALADLRHRH